MEELLELYRNYRRTIGIPEEIYKGGGGEQKAHRTTIHTDIRICIYLRIYKHIYIYTYSLVSALMRLHFLVFATK